MSSFLDEFKDQPGTLAAGVPAVERMGIEVVHTERGRAVMRLPFNLNINHVGMVYAGSIVTLAEVPGGTLFLSAFDYSRYYPIVGEISTRFVKPAMTDVYVDARMTDDEIERVTRELEENGKAKWSIDSELVDTNGTVVATSSATYFGLAFPEK